MYMNKYYGTSSPMYSLCPPLHADVDNLPNFKISAAIGQSVH